MKSTCAWLAVLGLLLVSTQQSAAQAVGDHRSNGTTGGNWNSNTTWQRYNGSSWVAATTPPTGTGVITVRSTDTVTVNAPVTISGTLVNQGRIASGENLTIANNGTFQHDQDVGTLPMATWGTGSTLLITGTISTAPSDRNQSFYNVTFNTPGLVSNRDMSWDSVTIRGNINVINTGTARWQMTSTSAGDSSIFTIMGDIIVADGQFSSNGTSNANTKFEIHQYGNIVVTGGNLSVSRGSQGSGTGSTRWYLHNGNFSMSNATTQNSNPTNAWFVFDKIGTQQLTLGAGNTLTALPIVVNRGTTLDMGVSKLRGSGLFTLNSGATLATASEGGVDSAINVTGTLTLSPTANFTFNGTAAQVTGLSMPNTVDTLVINNAAGVRLSQATTINKKLRLRAGVFNNTIPFTLGPGASISFEGGSLLIPVGVDDEDQLPQTFFVDQNFPNPFNPTTSIRYGLPQQSYVSARVFNLLGQEVATLFEGQKEAGIHTLNFAPLALGSGVYFLRIEAGNFVDVKRMVLTK